MSLKKTTIPQLPVATTFSGGHLLYQQGSTTKRIADTTIIDTIDARDLNPISKTYAEMAALVTASGLVTGVKYLITDATTANISLIVEAVAVNKIHTDAKSPDFPQDVIEYDFATDAIKWRWDTINDISVYQDLRNLSGLTIGTNCTNIHTGLACTGSIGNDNSNLTVEKGAISVGNGHLNSLNYYYGNNGFDSTDIGGSGQPHIIQITGRNNDVPVLMMQYTGNNVGNGGMHWQAARGIPGFPGPIQKGDPIYSIGVRGYGINQMRGSGGQFSWYASENYTDSAGGMWWVLGVTSNGSNVRDGFLAQGPDGRLILGMTQAQLTAMIAAGSSLDDGTGALFQIANGQGNVPPVELTQTEINALVPTGKWIVFNTTTGKHQAYDGATWNNLY